ncbi:hypothetical protein [Lactobacillus amylovorus]|uniref:hypothetical protein n=1 Tax=Lactobacillus amylovorus TaxID=1604 RepID=UPI003F8B5D35
MMNDIKIDQKRINAKGNFTQNINIGTADTQLLEKTQIYDCLKLFLDDDVPKDNTDTSVPPAKLNSKLIFNHAIKFINIFKNHYLDIVTLSNVIETDFSNDGNLIISDLRDQFFDMVPEEDYNPNTGEIISINNGYDILKKLHENICMRIYKDPRFDSKNLTIEIVSKFVYAFLGYGVEICQILLNPNKLSGESNDIS